MITITETAAKIGCSRTTIYAALKRLDLKPHKHKRKSLLDEQQIAKIKSAISSDTELKERDEINQFTDKLNERIRTEGLDKVAGRPSRPGGQDSQGVLVQQLQAEAAHLKALLEREQAERTAERIERADERKSERERSERHDALVTALLAEQKSLRDEVQRLKALQAPEPVGANNAPVEQDSSHGTGNEEGVGKKPMAAAASAHRSTSNVIHIERPNERPANVQAERQPVREKLRAFGAWLANS